MKSIMSTGDQSQYLSGSEALILGGIPDAQIEGTINLIPDLIGDYISWADALREIRMMTPKNIWLNHFSWEENGEAALNGMALSYEPIFVFRDNLADSSCFGSVKLVSMQNKVIGSSSLVQFEMLCEIRGNSPKPMKPREGIR